MTTRENFPIPTDTRHILDYLDYCIGVTSAPAGNLILAYLLIEASEAIANHADGALSKAAA